MFECASAINLSHRVGRCQPDFPGPSPSLRARLRVRRLGVRETDVDDRSLLDLGDPLPHARVVLLTIQDVAHLFSGLDERVAGEALLRLELEDVIPDLGSERRRDLTRLELEDGFFDVRRQLTALQRAEAATFLP